MASTKLRLLPGDRAPNFTLPDRSGKLRMFYEETRGLPILLFFYDRSFDAQEALSQIAAPQARLTAEAHVLAVADSDSDPIPEVGPPSPVVRLVDPLSRVGDAYRTAAGLPRGPALFVLDANQRLVETIRPAMGSDLARHVRALLDRHAAWAPATVHVELAPVLMIPRVLDGEICGRLMRVFETEGHDEGAVLSTANGAAADRLNYGSKKRLDHQVKDIELARELTGLLGPRLGAEVQRAFHFQGFWLEPFFIVCYDADRGDFFRPHRDNLIPELASRRFATTINLNDDYEGGGLRFPEYGPHRYRPPAGGAIVFSSSLLHEAVPVMSGRRFALLTFLRVGNPHDRPGPALPASGTPRPGATYGPRDA
jgi:predicted 2-oxoglutarate/Fe(II)-dependent dioxygenase YbiX